MSPRRGLLAAVLTLALTAGPAAAQSTTPGGSATIPGAVTSPDPGGTSSTVPGSTTTPGSTTSGGITTTPAAGTPTTPEITAAQAGDGILLDAADRVELASALAEATEESGVCFGYTVRLGGSGASDRDERLSNAGPDRTPDRAECPKGAVELQVSITYTSESSESEDSAGFSVSTDVPGLTDATQRLKDLSGVDEGDFTGSKDDLALRNATAALPLLLDGATPAELPAPAADGKAPNGDRLTGSPASDWFREHWLGLLIGALLLILALFLLAGGLLARILTRRSNPSRRPPPASSGPPDPPAGSSSTTTIP